MSKIITIAIHKGGTGKTTLVSHLAMHAHQQGLSVLLIDLDAQSNLSTFFKLDATNSGSSSLFLEKPTFEKQTIAEQFDLIHADEGLFGIERLPFESAQTFKKNLKALSKNYDLTIIDTPPTMGFAMLAPLIASDFVVSPVIPDAYSVNGVRSLFNRIKTVKAKQNPNLQFLGLVLNRFNSRNKQQAEMLKQFQTTLAGQIIAKPLADRSAIANAAYEGKAVWDKPKSGAARVAGQEMKQVMQELMQKMKLGAK